MALFLRFAELANIPFEILYAALGPTIRSLEVGLFLHLRISPECPENVDGAPKGAIFISLSQVVERRIGKDYAVHPFYHMLLSGS